MDTTVGLGREKFAWVRHPALRAARLCSTTGECVHQRELARVGSSWLEQFSSPELHTVYYKVRFMASGAHSPRSGSAQRHTETQSAWKRPGHRVGGGRLVAWILKRDR